MLGGADARGDTTATHPAIPLEGRSAEGAAGAAGKGGSSVSGPAVPPDEQQTVISRRGGQVEDLPFIAGGTSLELGRALEGRRLGHYQLDRYVGGGGMGAVFRAHDTALGRTVAVKVLSGNQSDPETIRRFRNEGQSAARLDHENIARVYDVGEEQGCHYIVFEFIEGTNVRDLVLDHGPLPLEAAIQYTLDVAEALQHAHQREVVHRDIKPSNLIVTREGRCKLVDMGLARLHQVEASSNDLTASGVTLGTFDYISPEQARDPRNADVRSDLYSLGCTLFYMLTGRPPYPEGTVLQKLLSHSSDEVPDPANFRHDLPRDLARIVHRLLAKQPANRYQQPNELIGELLLLAGDLGLEQATRGSRVWVEAGDRPARWWERIAPAAVGGALVLGAVLLADFLLRMSVPPASVAYFERPISAGSTPGEIHIPGRESQPLRGRAESSNGGPARSPNQDGETDDRGTGNGATGNGATGNGATGNAGTGDRATGNGATGNGGTGNSRAGGQGTTVPAANGETPGNGGASPQGAGGISEPPREPAGGEGGTGPPGHEDPPAGGTGRGGELNGESPAPLVAGGPPSAEPGGAGTTPSGPAAEEGGGTSGSEANRLPEVERFAGIDPAEARVLFVGRPKNRLPEDGLVVDELAEALQLVREFPEIHTLELCFNGPRPAAPFKLTRNGFTLRAGMGFEPLLLFAPLDRLTHPGMIEIDGADVSVQGLHLRLELPTSPADGWSLFRLNNARRLTLTACTMTIANVAGDSVTPLHEAAFLNVRATSVAGMENEMLMPAGEAARAPAPPTAVNLFDCIARGEATFLEAESLEQLELYWLNGLLATSERLLRSRGAPAGAADPRLTVILEHVTAYAARGLCSILTDGGNLQPLLDIDCRHCVLDSGAEAPLLEQRGFEEAAEVRRKLRFDGMWNIYPRTLLFWRLDPGNGASVTEVSFEEWTRMWERQPPTRIADWQTRPAEGLAVHRHRPDDYRRAASAGDNANYQSAGFEYANLPRLPAE